MRWGTSELSPGHTGASKRLQVDVGTQVVCVWRGCLLTGSVSIHLPCRGRLRLWSVEQITSLQGKAGNWWNTDFTEGWPENPWVTPSGWEPGCPHLGLGNRSPWRRGGGEHLTLLLFLSQKPPPVAPRTKVRGAPGPWQQPGIVPCIVMLSTDPTTPWVTRPLHRGTKGHHCLWNGFFHISGRWFWGCRNEG